MSFNLGSGPLRVSDLNTFMTRNQGVFQGLSNPNTPQAREFQQQLREFEQLRYSVAARSGDGTLPADQVGRIRQMAEGISKARLEAQKSQMRSDATTSRPTPPAGQDTTQRDPYRESNGRVYRPGASGQELRFGDQTIREGDKGEAVKAFQEQLLRAGFDLGPKGADGFFGPRTAAAARQFLQQYPDLNGRIDSRALQRAAGLAEGVASKDGPNDNRIERPVAQQPLVMRRFGRTDEN